MKCTKCGQRFLEEVKNLSNTKKTILPKVCLGCRSPSSRQSMRSMKEKKK